MHHKLRTELILEGVPLSPGFAVGKVCLFHDERHSNVPAYCVLDGGEAHEKARFLQARQTAEQDLRIIAERVRDRIGEAEAGIFEAHVMIMQDPELCADVDGLIDKEKLNAEAAVAEVLDSYEVRLLEIDDAYLRERATDFGEIKRRLLVELGGKGITTSCLEGDCKRGHDRIVVADELTPQLTVDMETDKVLAFVTERGGVNSHGAILARAMGIPAISGVTDICSKVACGGNLLVCGSTGTVVLWPGEETVSRFREREPEQVRMPTACAPVAGFRVMANISMPAEAAAAVQMQAEGIGLYRTEIEIITGHCDRSEDAFYSSYKDVLKTCGGEQVTFRLFDIGSDKVLPDLAIPSEQNPSLGLRGARLLLKNPDLLAMQARALARASVHGPVSVLYPMIVDVEQFQEIRDVFDRAVRDLDTGEIRHGAMFEVPSACLQADEILSVADFGSIGTNDLTQYTFAVDRDSEAMAPDYNPDHPVIWKLLEHVARSGERAGKSISVCGELAARPEHIARLLALGLRTVSVNVRMIPELRRAAKLALKEG